MKAWSFVLLSAALCGLLTAVNPARAQGTAFTYQGQLSDTGGPANGTYNFTFTLYTNSSGGTSVAGPVATNGVLVTNGLFTVQIDFGAAVWNGQTNWLELAVETNTANTFTTLAPRQQVTPTPYAIFATTASNLSGILPAAQLPPGVVTNNETGVTVSGTFTGNGGGLTNVPADWQTVSGTSQTAAANYAYLLTNNMLSTVTLPASPNVGDIVTVSGSGSNGWQVVPNGGQTIAGHSIPAGVIWTAQNGSPVEIWQSVASSSDGTKLVAVATPGSYGQIYTSGDSGVTWTVQNSAPSTNWASVASSADGTKLAAVVENYSEGGLIYTSADSGVTWIAQNGAPTTVWMSVASSADGTKLVAAANGGLIYTSGDSGVTWTAQNGAPPQSLFSIASSADGTKLVGAVNGGQIYTSSDSGVTWIAQNGAPSAVWYNVASSSDGTKLAAAGFGTGDAGGPIYTSSDSGVTWTAQNSGSQPWYSVALSSDGTKLVAGGLGYPISTSGDSGVTWTQQNSSVQFWTSIASSSDGTKLVAVAEGGQIYTSDAANYYSGGPGNKAQFQYVGNGVWMPLSQVAGPISLAQLPAGVVTNGEGGVNISGTFTGNGAGISNVNLINVNGDGAINWATNVSWGNFVLSSSVNVTGGLPVSVTAADVNGDGYLDLITANENGNSLSVFTNNTAGGFALASTLSVPGAPYSVTAADVNGDGHVDLISADGPNNTLSVYTNDGTGYFVLSATLTVGNYASSVIAADVNGDGHIDLICANESDSTLTVLTNDGTGGFKIASSPTTGRSVVCVVAADVNGDGHIDLICANLTDNTLTVLTNNGTGGFVLASTLLAGTDPHSVCAADVNADGWIDLICANSADDTLTILTNNRAGGFALSATLPTGHDPRCVVAADVNADGHADLICANYGDTEPNSLTVLTNNGTGGFALSSTLPVGFGPMSVVAADVNNDGEPDLISANADETLSVLFNTYGPSYMAFFIGNGAGLTGLNFSQLSGTGSVVTLNETNVVLASLTATNLSVGGTNVIAPLSVPPGIPNAAIGTVGTGQNPGSVAVAGRYVYVANQGSSSLQVFDVSTPAHPVAVGLVSTGQGPSSVAVAGRYAYVVNSSANTDVVAQFVGEDQVRVHVGDDTRAGIEDAVLKARLQEHQEHGESNTRRRQHQAMLVVHQLPPGQGDLSGAQHVRTTPRGRPSAPC